MSRLASTPAAQRRRGGDVIGLNRHRQAHPGVIDSSAMIVARSYLARTARWLCLLVLVNGWVCALGHGQMLAPLFGHEAPTSHHHGGMDRHMKMSAAHDTESPGPMRAMADSTDMNDMPSPAGSPPSSTGSLHGVFSECFFAGSLPLAVLLFTVLGWLARHRRVRPPATRQAWRQPPRTFFPGLNPQAP